MADDLLTKLDAIFIRAALVKYPIKILGQHGCVGLGRFENEEQLRWRAEDVRRKLAFHKTGLKVIPMAKR